ncbi:MAG TPA: hypothetical protein PK838_06660, partial [Thermoleophilia bacterium]|nr:hypothetical protein [Thermoleophilia bacterium]
DGDVEGVAARLRGGRPAVVGRVHEGRLLLDARTVCESDVADLIAVAGAALRGEVAEVERG